MKFILAVTPRFFFYFFFCVQSDRTKEDYMSYLVPMEIALRHVAVLTLLGSIHHTQ